MRTKKVRYSCLSFSVKQSQNILIYMWLKHYLSTKALPVFYLLKIDTVDINTYNKWLGVAPSNSGQVLKSLLSEVGRKNLITFDGTPLSLEWSIPRTRRQKRRSGSNLVFVESNTVLSPNFVSTIKWPRANYFLFPLKSWFLDDFRGNKRWSICADSLNNGNKFWQQFLLNSIQQCLMYEKSWFKKEKEAKASSSKL